MNSTARHRGFTLIELLVVVAIIAILAAILVPVFLSAREQAKQAQCLSNLYQLGRAMRLYADDWDSRLPTVMPFPPECPWGSYLNWCGSAATGAEVRLVKGQIFPYVKSKGIYMCPSDYGAKVLWGPNPFPLSYSMNFVLSWRSLETMQKPGFPASGLNRRLGKLLLLIHEKRERINDGCFNWAASWWDIPDDVHHDGTTVLFCDLHARWQNARTINEAIAKREYDPDWPQP